jgi:dTDP-4-dehydrorhamnose reductase
MRAAAAQGKPVRVVSDQTGAPTSARLVAEAVWGLAGAGAGGTWHVAAAGATSWHGVARAVFDEAGAPVSLVASCRSDELRRPATRPAFSVLDCRRTAERLGVALPRWEDQVRFYVRTGALPACGVMGPALIPAEGV